MDFVNKHDGPHNLSIVYYTGHASSHEANGLLELHAYVYSANCPGFVTKADRSVNRADTQADTPKGDYHASAFWNHAERPMIEDGEGDMVAIFDTCFASNLHKNIQPEDGRTYELLTASGHGRLTAGPGPKSFTAALMKSLNDLLEECRNKPFTIRQLCERINLQPTRLKNPSHVWSRLNRFDRNIALAPLTRTLAEREKEFDLDQSRALLFLRLSVTVDLLTEQQIKTIAQAFSKAVKSTKTPVKRIDWWRFQGLGPMRQIIRFADLVKVVGSAVKWKNIMLSSQQAQPSITTWDGNIQTMDDPLPHPTHDPNTLDSVLVESASEPTPPPHVSHKRKYSRGHHSTSSSPLKRAP